MKLGQLQKRLTSFSGFELEPLEATELLNEARRRFALRSRYPRKIASVGNTVAGQAAYDWPSDLLLPLRLSVAGTPWEATDPETAQRYALGELVLQREGGWYDAPGEDAARKLYLYPTPTTPAGNAIQIEYIYRPPDLVSQEDEPTEIPEEFHAALLPEVASYYYETVEDDPDLAQRNSEKADQWVLELRKYENQRRSGTNVFKVAILGVDT